MSKYATGADMWREYRAQYGDAEARGICNRYLDLQVNNTDPGELAFCRELYAAMQADLPLLTQAEFAEKSRPVGQGSSRCSQHETTSVLDALDKSKQAHAEPAFEQRLATDRKRGER